MKKNIQHIILILVAATIFYTGVGVTVASYCCMPFVNQLSFFSTGGDTSCCSSQCCDRGESEQSAHASLSTIDIQNTVQTDCCQVFRLSSDLDVFTPQLKLPSRIIYYLEDSFISSFHVIIPFTAFTLHSNQFFVYFSPRQYLTIIRVLLI